MKKLKFGRSKSETSGVPALTTEQPKRRTKRLKRPKVKLPKIASAWRLFRSAWSDYRADWKRYVLILGVATIPLNFASIFNLSSADPLTGSYLSFFTVVTNVAVIWAMVQREKTGRVSTLAEAYYDGSAAIVRFILITFALVAMLVPAALGAALYILAATASDISGVGGPELVGVGIVAVAFAIPSFILLVRYGLAPFAAVRDGLRPMAALRRARIYSLGRFWALAGRYISAGIFLLIVGIPLYLCSELFVLLKWPTVANFVFETLMSLVLLPIGNLFMLRIYRALEHSFNARAAEELDGIPEPAEASA
jgi:hypothetical protein